MFDILAAAPLRNFWSSHELSVSVHVMRPATYFCVFLFATSCSKNEKPRMRVSEGTMHISFLSCAKSWDLWGYYRSWGFAATSWCCWKGCGNYGHNLRWPSRRCCRSGRPFTHVTEWAHAALRAEYLLVFTCRTTSIWIFYLWGSTETSADLCASC